MHLPALCCSGAPACWHVTDPEERELNLCRCRTLSCIHDPLQNKTRSSETVNNRSGGLITSPGVALVVLVMVFVVLGVVGRQPLPAFRVEGGGGPYTATNN